MIAFSESIPNYNCQFFMITTSPQASLIVLLQFDWMNLSFSIRDLSLVFKNTTLLEIQCQLFF